MDKSKLDRHSRNQLENAEQNQKIAELCETVGQLADRVTVLEEARKVQIGLNTKFMENIKANVNINKPKKSLLELILGK
jgi:hypothetical protein